MRLIDADAFLAKFNKKTDIWSALTDEKTAEEFALFCKVKNAVEELPTIGGWISVKERLPTESGQYLVYIRHWQCDGYTEVCGFDADKKEFGKIDMDYAYDNDGWYSVNYVTHWQKLPEAPKEEDDNG